MLDHLMIASTYILYSYVFDSRTVPDEIKLRFCESAHNFDICRIF
jgi:hypothetical protein